MDVENDNWKKSVVKIQNYIKLRNIREENCFLYFLTTIIIGNSNN